MPPSLMAITRPAGAPRLAHPSCILAQLDTTTKLPNACPRQRRGRGRQRHAALCPGQCCAQLPLSNGCPAPCAPSGAPPALPRHCHCTGPPDCAAGASCPPAHHPKACLPLPGGTTLCARTQPGWRPPLPKHASTQLSERAALALARGAAACLYTTAARCCPPTLPRCRFPVECCCAQGAVVNLGIFLVRGDGPRVAARPWRASAVRRARRNWAPRLSCAAPAGARTAVASG